VPRSRQGGPRAGTPGGAYVNRTDLNTNRTLPVKAAPGQVYGQAAAQEQAQKAVPMGPPGAGAPQAGPQQAPQGMPPVPPGGFGDIHRPTERPLEPVTAGAALGPGPGTEALGAPVASAMSNVSSLLQQAAAATGSNVLTTMAARASAVGQ
jgi:hypothetical protein